MNSIIKASTYRFIVVAFVDRRLRVTISCNIDEGFDRVPSIYRQYELEYVTIKLQTLQVHLASFQKSADSDHSHGTTT